MVTVTKIVFMLALESQFITEVKEEFFYYQPSEYRTPEMLDSSENLTVWVSRCQMVKSCDLADHLNTLHVGQ